MRIENYSYPLQVCAAVIATTSMSEYMPGIAMDWGLDKEKVQETFANSENYGADLLIECLDKDGQKLTITTCVRNSETFTNDGISVSSKAIKDFCIKNVGIVPSVTIDKIEDGKAHFSTGDTLDICCDDSCGVITKGWGRYFPSVFNKLTFYRNTLHTAVYGEEKVREKMENGEEKAEATA